MHAITADRQAAGSRSFSETCTSTAWDQTDTDKGSNQAELQIPVAEGEPIQITYRDNTSNGQEW